MDFESDHVHSIYDLIASDFSRTRHTRWPFVTKFLQSLNTGSIVLDAGCGNGKYLGCSSVLPYELESTTWTPSISSSASKATGTEANILPIGFDMSSGLLGIAKGKGHEVVRGDCIDLACWRRGAFDHAISIATIHHLSTSSRRQESIKQMMLSVLPLSPPSSSRPNPNPARILIVVWALEQDPELAGVGSARRGKKGAVPVSPEEEGEGGGDVFVPWSLQGPKEEKKEKIKGKKPNSRKRGTEEVEENLEKVTLDETPTATATATATGTPAPPPKQGDKPTYNRYYHLFRRGELSELVRGAAGDIEAEFVEGIGAEMNGDGEGEKEKKVLVRLKEERWERENWVVEVEVGWR